MSEQWAYARKRVMQDHDPKVGTAAPMTSVAGVARPVPGVLTDSGPLRRSVDADPLGGQAVDEGAQSVLSRRRGGGAPLPEALTGPLQNHFRTDLTGVRVHADAEAGRLAQSLQATAFTHGTDVYFAPGAYRPASEAGQRVIAHEIGHVVAQRSGADRASGSGLTVGRAADPAEAAADRAADAAMVALRRSPARAGAAVAASAKGTGPGAPVPGRSPVADPLRRSTAPLRRATPVLGGHRGAAVTEARGNTAEQGVGTYAGVNTKTTSVDQTKKGGSEGTRTETTAKAVAGAWHAAKAEREVFNGKSKVKSAGEINSLAGAEAWAKKITEASDDQLLYAVSALARAGAFSAGSGEASYQRGMFSAGAKGEYNAMAGAVVGGEAYAKVDKSGLIPAVEAAFKAYGRAGAGIDANAEIFAKLGRLEFIATGEVSAFAGAEAAAEGKAWAKWNEVGASGSASVFAGARASAGASTTLKLGPAELMAMAEASAKAGAWASVSGKIVISFTGVEIGGEAEAFAGATASASAKAAFSFRGKEILSAKGEVTVDAGAGGKVKGKFALKGGKLSLDFGAKAVLGIGGGMDGAFNVDLVALGEAIGTQIYESIAKYTVEITGDAGQIDREPIVDPLKAATVKKLGYDIYLPHFRGYAASKLGGGDNGIKRQRVQEILDEYRGAIGRNLLYIEADAGITMAAEEAFGKMLKHIKIVGGKIEEFDAVASAGIGAVRVDHAQEQARTALRAALAAKAEEGRKGTAKKAGTHVPDNAAINAALSKKYDDLLKAFGKDAVAADAEAGALIEEVFKGFWTHVVVRGGKVSTAVVNRDAAAAADAEAAETARTTARMQALSALQTACAAYAAEKAAGGKNGVKEENVAALIKKHGGPLLATGDPKTQAVADRVISDMVRRGLGAAVTEFVYAGGAITKFTAGDASAIKQQFKADAAAAKRRKSYDTARTKLAAYAAKKTGQGANGIKEAEVQKIVSAAVSDAGKANIDEADRELTVAVRDGLGTLINHVQMKGGVVQLVISQTRMAAAKEKHAADAARVGKNFGDDQGNERRYDVASRVRPVMEGYFADLRTNPQLVPQLGRIDALVTQAMSSRKDELAFADAQAELVLTINRVFDGVVEVSVDDTGKLSKMSYRASRLAEIRRQSPLRAAVAAPLNRYAMGLANERPTLGGLQAAVDRAAAAAQGMDAAERDAVLMDEIMTAFGSRRIKSVTVKGGMVTALKAGQ